MKTHRYVFQYWESKPGTTPPEYLELCDETIRHNCGRDFEIVLLNEKTMFDWLPGLRTDILNLKTIAHRADYIRWKLLYEYGGIWLDRDFIITKPLIDIYYFLGDFDFIGCGKILPNILCPSIGFMCANKGFEIGRIQIEKMDEVLSKNFDAVNSEIGWCAIGTEILRHFINEHKYLLLPDEYLFPLYWTEYKKFFDETVDIKKYLVKNNYGFALYNQVFEPWFKSMKKEEILKSNMPISTLFKKGMGK